MRTLVLSTETAHSLADVVGYLNRIRHIVFGGSYPSALMYRGRTETIREEGEEVVPKLAIPFAAKADLDLTQTGDELTVHIGAYKRKVVLPRPLMGRAVSAQSS